MESEWDESFAQETRENLELQFSPSKWAKRPGLTPEGVVKNHVHTLGKESEKAKEKKGDCELDIAYGERPKEKLDIFGAKTVPKDAPVFVYIHGGYWQQLGRESSCFMAPALVNNGNVFVAIGYHIAPEVDMPEIELEVKKAIAYVLKWAQKRNSIGVYLGGHCAGGHLAALMLGVDWKKECDVDDNLIKGVVSFSGIFDIRPLVNTYINDAIKMTDDVAWQYSPCKHIEIISKQSVNRVILLTIGENDSPAFRQQNKAFSEALQKRNVKVRLIDMKGADHFHGVENTVNEGDEIVKEISSLMKGELHECQ